MANLSKIKRDKMLAFLEELKTTHNDDASIRAFNEIENQLRDKKYGLVWEEHSEQVDEMLEESIPVLCEDNDRRICKDDSLPWNFIIEGDNLQALYLLEKTHRGKVDCIYIDPPYNTGSQDWKYNKRKAEESDVSWRSLRRTGDESLRGDAKNCFFPIFVKDEIVVGFGDVCEDNFHPKKPYEQLADGTIAIYPLDPNGIERKWGYARQSIEKIKDQLILKKTNKSYDIYIGYMYVTQRTVWDSPLYDANAYGTQILSSILTTTFPFPKSIHLVEDCLKAIIHKKDATFLDFFAGSGTTGNAVLNMNLEDNGTRHFILVTNNELSALAKLEYLKNNGYMLDYIPTKRTKATAIERSIDKFLEDHSDVKQKLFGSKESLKEYFEYGICRGVTYQRLRTIISGVRKDGSQYSDGMNANLKYYKCDWTPRKPEDYLLSNVLCLHIKEMIELQNAIEVDNVKNVILLNKDDYTQIIQDPDIYAQIEHIWINQNMILSPDEMAPIKAKGFKYIPREFFSQELREAAE